MATRAQAVAKARKLAALAERTRHEGERWAACAALGRLVAKYDLDPLADLVEPRVEPRRWQAPRRGAPEPWSFDIHTGQASPNVKVHSYRDRANWRIEVPPGGVWDDSANRRAAVEAIRRRDPRLRPPR